MLFPMVHAAPGCSQAAFLTKAHFESFRVTACDVQCRYGSGSQDEVVSFFMTGTYRCCCRAARLPHLGARK